MAKEEFSNRAFSSEALKCMKMHLENMVGPAFFVVVPTTKIPHMVLRKKLEGIGSFDNRPSTD